MVKNKKKRNFKETLEIRSESILKLNPKHIRKMSGITLLALVITIVVLIILATVSINMLFGENGLVTSANMATLMSEFSTYIEEKEMFDASKKLEDLNYDEETLNASKGSLAYDEQVREGNITTVIPSMKDGYLDKFEIIKGELYVNTADDLEIRVAQALGLNVNPYLIIDGVLMSANQNLGLQTGSNTLTIPGSVTAIGAGAFSGVKGLKEVIIPGTVQEIRADAFSYNTEIEKVTIQNGTVSIGENAFRGCTNLQEITIPDSVIEIGKSAFYGCTNLTKVQLSNNISILNVSVFSSCNNLTEINMPTNLTQISDTAFWYCYQLNNITIPAGVTSIASNAFNNCTSLTNITIDPANEVYEIDEEQPGIIYIKENGVRTSLIMLAPMANEETVRISEGITRLEDGALSICTNMKTLELPSSLSSIGGNTFLDLRVLENISFPQGNNNYTVQDGYLYGNNGTELIYVVPTKTQIEIGENVKIIKAYAIQNRNITELNIPNTVTTIENFALRFASNLKKIHIGSGVSSLSSQFKSWSSIPNGLEIEIDGNNQNYKVENNLILTKDGTEVVTYVDKNVQTQEIPTNVVKIRDYAFTDFNITTEIILPNTLKEIGRFAFQYCEQLTAIEIPSSVESIGNHAFNNCSNLGTIKINKTEGDLVGAPWGAPKGDRVLVWNEQ